jgi:hypothetical protein
MQYFTFSDFYILFKNVISNVVFQNLSWKQEVDVFSLYKCIQSIRKGKIDVGCVLLLQYCDLSAALFNIFTCFVLESNNTDYLF